MPQAYSKWVSPVQPSKYPHRPLAIKLPQQQPVGHVQNAVKRAMQADSAATVEKNSPSLIMRKAGNAPTAGMTAIPVSSVPNVAHRGKKKKLLRVQAAVGLFRKQGHPTSVRSAAINYRG